LPRIAEWPRIAAVIDALVVAAIGTDRPEAELLAEAQERLVNTL
jgi:hypothetical protein